jgi:hypothetical protein
MQHDERVNDDAEGRERRVSDRERERERENAF